MPEPTPTGSSVRARAEAARAAALSLQGTSDEARRKGVRAIAAAVADARQQVEAANREDQKVAAEEGLAKPLVDRLALQGAKLDQLLAGVRQVAELPDPLGRTLRATRLDDGLDLYQVTVPLGVLGVVFESRPDALVQIAALAVRSGNAVLLKGGREAERTNVALADAVRHGLRSAGLPEDAVVLLQGREEVEALLRLDGLVDLVIPRGSSAFVRYVQEHTHIPVLGHAEGVCHVYVDKAADLDKALDIVIDAKADHPAACNAAETVLVHAEVKDRFLPMLERAAKESRIVLLHGEGFGTEFGDLRLAVGVVEGLEAAIAHVNRHGSRHTDTIVTGDRDRATRFLRSVDAASVMVNVSTRFADGFRYGLGAEVGVSTSKVHARGPVGLEGLTTTKWIVEGSGQTAGPYQGESRRPFRHAALDAEWGP